MDNTTIQNIIEDFMRHLGLDVEVVGVDTLTHGEMTKFSLKVEEPYLLIGHDGKTLMSLNYILKKILEKECTTRNTPLPNIIIDVDDYQERKIEEIKNKAHMMAERARFFKSNVEMSPMNPYERMIIHSIFTATDDISTESVGKGRERRVMLRYHER